MGSPGRPWRSDPARAPKLRARYREHAVGIVVSQILIGGEGESEFSARNSSTLSLSAAVRSSAAGAAPSRLGADTWLCVAAIFSTLP
jgi:hypothetical protein